MPTPKKIAKTWFLAAFGLLVLAACSPAAPEPTPTPAPSLPEEIVFHGWGDEDQIEGFFDAFEAEYGVRVRYVPFESTEEAVENIRSGMALDIVNVENFFIPTLIEEGLLASIQPENLVNYVNISPGFRGMVFDPGNQYTIPYNWGTTAILVRTDRVSESIESWADLFNPAYANQVVLWETTPRYTLGAALKSLGFSVNSENPEELEAALQVLLTVKNQTIWMRDESTIVEPLTSGNAALGLGWGYDYWTLREQTENIEYVLPKEGSILWTDSLVIPASSPNPETARLLIDFFLRAEVAARIVEFSYYPVANDAAWALVDPAIATDPVVRPGSPQLANAELILPLSAAGEALYQAAWEKFLSAP